MSSVSGWEGELRVATSIANVEASGSKESAIQSVTPSIGNNVEGLYEIGSREPVEVKEGNIEVSLDITAHYQSGTPTTWSARAGVGAGSVALTEYYVAIYPNGATSTEPEIRLLGKFNDYSFAIDQDGIVVESISFVGRLVAVGAAWLG